MLRSLVGSEMCIRDRMIDRLRQSRALEAETRNMDLEQAVQNAHSTIESLRQMIVSQETQIASMQNEARMCQLREAQLEQEAHVAQETLRRLQDMSSQEQPVTRFVSARPTDRLLDDGVNPSLSSVTTHHHIPVSQSVLPVSQSVLPVSQRIGRTNMVSADFPSPASSKERTDALLSQVRNLQHALSDSIQKRQCLSQDVDELGLSFESSLDRTQQLALDATADKWRATLQANGQEVEHQAYSDRIRTLEQHVLNLQSENQVLQKHKDGSISANVDDKVKLIMQ
eukprot:TRINITY_DN4028_c0_g1_i2.p1 TRINITY_DN4028_c0_g1~~TRINITY_DN4028_c0_g1_i2.p1  ORF type:complete len:284 (+),score=57.23 TRINITY_DN4028_c0_g1_i2:96-947(+)